MSVTSMSPAVERPDHVPVDLVYDFDFHFDPALLQNAHERILQVAKEAPPVFWTPRHGGHWIIRSYDAVYKAQRDPATFSNSPFDYDQVKQINETLDDDHKLLLGLPITVDPPIHAVYRAPLNKTFSPKTILNLKDSIRELAVDLIENVKSQGGCEFMSAIAEPLPVTIFLRMFGLPIDRQAEYRKLVAEHLRTPFEANDQQDTMARQRRIAMVLRETILDRRENPREDIISMLWQTDIDGKPMSLNDVENYCVILTVAGLDTVMNGMGLGVRHLALNPQLQATLRKNPTLVPEAAEELLRRYTFTVPPRFLKHDVEFEGISMKKGEMALMFLPAADLDPAEFETPEDYNLERENKVHIAFGTGPHRCLGSHLARVELQVLFEEMLKRLPEFRLDPAKPVTFHGGNVIGPNELHLVWECEDGND